MDPDLGMGCAYGSWGVAALRPRRWTDQAVCTARYLHTYLPPPASTRSHTWLQTQVSTLDAFAQGSLSLLPDDLETNPQVRSWLPASPHPDTQLFTTSLDASPRPWTDFISRVHAACGPSGPCSGPG